MSALRIELRNKLVELTASALPEYNGHVTSNKLDKVEKGVAASVYLAPVTSAPVAMRGIRNREQRVTVSLFSEDQTDIDAKLSDQVNILEKAVEEARLEGAFGAITTVYMETAEPDQDPTSKGKRGEVHITFLFLFTETL